MEVNGKGRIEEESQIWGLRAQWGSGPSADARKSRGAQGWVGGGRWEPQSSGAFGHTKFKVHITNQKKMFRWTRILVWSSRQNFRKHLNWVGTATEREEAGERTVISEQAFRGLRRDLARETRGREGTRGRCCQGRQGGNRRGGASHTLRASGTFTKEFLFHLLFNKILFIYCKTNT